MRFLWLDSAGVWAEGSDDHGSSAGGQRSETLLLAGRGERDPGRRRRGSGEAGSCVRKREHFNPFSILNLWGMALLMQIEYIFEACGGVGVAEAAAVARSASEGHSAFASVLRNRADKSRMFRLASAGVLIVCCRVRSLEKQPRHQSSKHLDIVLMICCRCCFGVFYGTKNTQSSSFYLYSVHLFGVALTVCLFIIDQHRYHRKGFNNAEFHCGKRARTFIHSSEGDKYWHSCSSDGQVRAPNVKDKSSRLLSHWCMTFFFNI